MSRAVQPAILTAFTTAHFILGCGFDMSVANECGFCRSAAHVEGEKIVLIDLIADECGGDDAGGRSRFNHRRWHPKGLRDVDDPAGRSHYMQSRQIETTDRLFEA